MSGIIFGQTQKGKKKLIDSEGYSYVVNSISKNKKIEYWRCTRKGCHGRFIYHPATREGKLSTAHISDEQPDPKWRARDAAVERLRELTLSVNGSVKAIELVRSVLKEVSPEVRSLLPSESSLVEKVKRWARACNIELVKASPEDYLIPEGDELLRCPQKLDTTDSNHFPSKDPKRLSAGGSRFKLLKRVDEDGNEIGAASLEDFLSGSTDWHESAENTSQEKCDDQPSMAKPQTLIIENDTEDNENDCMEYAGGDDFQIDSDPEEPQAALASPSKPKHSHAVVTSSNLSTRKYDKPASKEALKSGERCFVCGDELIVSETLASSKETFRKACCYLNVKSDGTWFPTTENAKFYSFCEYCTNEIMRIHNLYRKVEEIQSLIFKKVESVEKRIADAEIVDNWMAEAPHSTAVRFEGFRKQVMINYRNKLKLRREIRFGKKMGERFTEVLPGTSANMFASDPSETEAFRKLAPESTVDSPVQTLLCKTRGRPKSKRAVEEESNPKTVPELDDMRDSSVAFSDNNDDDFLPDFDDSLDAMSVASEKETKFWQTDPTTLDVSKERNDGETNESDFHDEEDVNDDDWDSSEKTSTSDIKVRLSKTSKGPRKIILENKQRKKPEPVEPKAVRDSHSRQIKFPDAVLTKDGRVFMEGIEIIKNPPGVYKSRPVSVSFSCGACGKIIPKFWNMRLHICGHHLHMYKCHICNKEFTDPKIVNRHIAARHEAPKYENCPVCGKPVRMGYVRNQTKMKYHQWSHLSKEEKLDPQYRSWCPRPEKEFNLPSAQIEKQTFMCGQCGKSFLFPSALKRHEMKHNAPAEVTELMCQFCGKTFLSRIGLTRHSPVCKSNTQRLTTISKTYPCPKCPSRFNSATARCRHVRRLHRNKNSDLPFSCPKCPRSFSSRSGFRQHKRVCVDGEVGHRKKNEFSNQCNEQFEVKVPSDSSLSPTRSNNRYIQDHSVNSQLHSNNATAALGFSYNFMEVNYPQQ